MFRRKSLDTACLGSRFRRYNFQSDTMSDKIETGKALIKDVFSRWYRVPDYQRPYVWGRDQVNDLLEDVATAHANKPTAEYFLGSIVLQQRQITDAKNKEDYEECDLLDGQQRLTTCLLIHAVARDLTHAQKLKTTCKETIFQEENPFDGIPERIRIVFDIRGEARDFITSFIKPDDGTANADGLTAAEKHKDVSVRNMATAVKEIRRYFTSAEAPKVEDFLQFFRNKVLLIFVASSQLEDAFRLFTVLNDRGMKLRNSDILKTLNLRALKEAGASETEQHEAAELWEELEGELGEDFDVFLAHIRTILVKEKARMNLLQEFEENIYEPKRFDAATAQQKRVPPLLTPGRATFEFIKRYRQHHLHLYGTNHSARHGWQIDNLVTLLRDASLADFWLPPLLHFREIFGDEHLLEFLKKLENKFCGDWIARETPTYRIEAMNAVIHRIDDLRQGGGTKAAQVAALLGSPVFDFNRDEFFKQLETAAIYGRRFARYILFKLDMIYGGQSTRLQPPQEISVEHVLPQNPAETSQWCKDFGSAERDVWTDRLGNLVLISRRKNTAQGRLDYGLKKSKYFEKNIETFPNSIRVLQNSVWTPVTLAENHRQVLETLRRYVG
jgi:hypothetical protein